MRARITLVIMTILLLIPSLSSSSRVFISDEEVAIFQDLTIEPQDSQSYSVELLEGEGIYGYVKVTHGVGIYFIIVDRTGHLEIANRSDTEPFYENSYYREDGKDHCWNFTAPHSSTWYVYFSKLLNAPLWDQSATLQGDIRKDITPPSMEMHLVEGQSSGYVDVHYDVRDRGFPIAWITLLANESERMRIDSPICEFARDVGYSSSGHFRWWTGDLENGTYFLRIEASDSLGHANRTVDIMHIVENPPPPIGTGLLIYGLVSLGAVGAIIYTVRNRDRTARIRETDESVDTERERVSLRRDLWPQIISLPIVIGMTYVLERFVLELYGPAAFYLSLLGMFVVLLVAWQISNR